MEYELMNVCMECDYEWEENNAIRCPKCNSGDFHTENEIDYYDITLEECFVKYYKEKIACVCDADEREIIFVEE